MKRLGLLLITTMLCCMGAFAQDDEALLFRGEVDVCPKCPQLADYLKTALTYPKAALDKDIDGTVHVTFIVEADGKVSNLQTKRDDNPLLATEALKVFRNMPKWTPGMAKGKNVRTRITIFVDYSFDGKLAGLTKPKELKAAVGKTFVNVDINFADPTPDDRRKLTIYKSEVAVVSPHEKKPVAKVPGSTQPVEEEEEMASVGVTGVLDFDEDSDEGIVMRDEKVLVIERPLSMTNENQVYEVVEQAPTFAGHPNGVMGFIANNLHYPPLAEENGEEGKVVCQFVIEKDGSVGDIRVARSASPELDKEAVRVIKSMPKWTPGRQNGKPVRVRYTLPINFRLQDPVPPVKKD